MFLLLINNQAPQQGKISRIEFETATRGYHKNITITSRMIMIKQQSRDDVNEHTMKLKIKQSDWNDLLTLLKNISLDEIATLVSPTMQRASDAARTSTLSVVDVNGTLYSHTFDNEDPNEKLKPLMTRIIAIERRTEVRK